MSPTSVLDDEENMNNRKHEQEYQPKEQRRSNTITFKLPSFRIIVKLFPQLRGTPVISILGGFIMFYPSTV